MFQIVSTRRYQISIPAWFHDDPFKLSWRARVFIRTFVHEYVRHIPIFGVAQMVLCARLRPRCFQFHLPFLNLHLHPYGREADVLTGRVVADSVGVVTSFTLFFPFAFVFLAIVVGTTALVCLFFCSDKHVRTRSNSSSVLSFCSVPPCPWSVLPFLVRTLTSMSFGPLLLFGATVTRTCCVARTEESPAARVLVVLQELKSHQLPVSLRRYPVAALNSASGVELARMKALCQGRELFLHLR